VKNKKILIFKIGAIGDVLMTTPFVRQARKNFPRAKIDYLVGKTAFQVLDGNRNLDEVVSFDEKIFFKKNIPAMLSLIRQARKRKYDMVFVMDKHWIFNFIAFLFGIKERIGFDRLGREGIFLTKRVTYDKVRHEIFYYLDLLKVAGCAVDYNDYKIDLFLNDNDYFFAENLWKIYRLNRKKVIGIAPGGGKNPGEKTEIRNWEINKYIELIKKLVDKNYFVLLVGGPSDSDKEKKILECLKSKKIISIIGKSSIKESAAVIKKCNYFVCNDSGPMHIAAAVNKNIISVFGPTNPKRKAPLYKESHAIWKDKDIYDEKYELFGKSPSKKFMTRIDVDDVLKYIK